MRTTIHGRHVFECDCCGNALETNTPDFSAAMIAFRGAGWLARQVGADWVHTCKGCQNVRERESRARSGGRIP